MRPTATRQISLDEAYGSVPKSKGSWSVDEAYALETAPQTRRHISVEKAFASPAAGIIEVEGPDGTIIEFPDDTAPDVMKAAMAKHYGKPAAPLSEDEQFQQDHELRKAVGRTILQGATFGFSDEIIGAARAGWEKLSGGERTYEQLRDEERAALEAYAKENPKMAMALELAGGFAVPGLGAAKLAASIAKATGRRSVAGASVGAGYGAVQGAGEAEEVGDIPADAATHAGVGAAGGLALMKAADAATGAGRWFSDQAGNLVQHLTDAATKFVPSDRIARGWANRAAVEQVEQNGIKTARDFDLATLQATSEAPLVPVVAADLGDRPTRLAAEALVNSDRGLETARHLHRMQGRDAIDPIVRFNDARFGIQAHERDTIRLNELERMRARDEYAAYQPHLDTERVTAPELLRVLEARPHARAAWEGAQTNWHNRVGRQLTADEIGLQRPVPGSYIAGPNGELIPLMEHTEVPLGLLDDMLKASSQRLEKLNDPRALEVNGEGTYASQKAHDALVDAVRRVDQRHGTDLTGIRQRYSEALQPSDARALGMQSFSVQPGEKLGDAIRQYDALPPKLQRDFAVGYMDALRRAMAESGDEGFNVSSLFRSVEHRELLDRVLRHSGAGEQIRDMMETMARRNRRNANFIAAAENRPIQRAGDQFSDAVETASLAKLSAIAGARGALRSVLTPYTQRRSDALVDLLMTTGGRDRLREAVAAAERSRNNRAIRRADNDLVRDAMIQSLLAQHAPFTP